MDIYRYISSPDVAAHCREIGKTWTPVEMAVIIGRSEHHSVPEKHAAWRELMTEYADMPIPQAGDCKGYDSLHSKLTEIIDYENLMLAMFKKPEPDTVYIYKEKGYYSKEVSTSFEKCRADIMDSRGRDELPEIVMRKVYLEVPGDIEASFDYDGNLYDIDVYAEAQTKAEWFPGVDFGDGYMRGFEMEYPIDMPAPFKRGDILTRRFRGEKESDRDIFVVESISFDLTDSPCGWGQFVDENGNLYGDHFGVYDVFEYYRGKLEGKQRLLHYVSLFINEEIRLPELLTVYSRIVLEHQLDNNLCIDVHGVFIPESLLAENRLTPDEKEEIEKNGGLMPWVAGKLSIRQVEFLAREFGGSNQRVQAGLEHGGGSYLWRCARIVHDENHYAKTNDAKFNPARRDMARMVLDAYDHTENDWIDPHADGNCDVGGILIPDYTKMK